jgi:hypothetical protein
MLIPLKSVTFHEQGSAIFPGKIFSIFIYNPALIPLNFAHISDNGHLTFFEDNPKEYFP